MAHYRYGKRRLRENAVSGFNEAPLALLKRTFVLVVDSTIMMRQLPEGAPDAPPTFAAPAQMNCSAGSPAGPRRRCDLNSERSIGSLMRGSHNSALLTPTVAACMQEAHEDASPPWLSAEANSTEPLEQFGVTKCFIYIGNSSHSC